MCDVEYLKIAGYLKSSTYRLNVVKFLNNVDYSMPREIAKGINIKPNHISKVLKDLKEKDIVECVNPEARKGRLYHLTSTGEKVVPYLEKIK